MSSKRAGGLGKLEFGVTIQMAASTLGVAVELPLRDVSTLGTRSVVNLKLILRESKREKGNGDAEHVSGSSSSRNIGYNKEDEISSVV